MVRMAITWCVYEHSSQEKWCDKNQQAHEFMNDCIGDIFSYTCPDKNLGFFWGLLHVSHQKPMSRVVNTIVIWAMALVSTIAYAEPQSPYVAEFSCDSGSFGLHLPPQLPAVMKLGAITREDVHEVEKWEGYTTTRKYVYFSGLTLGLITFSNDPNHYMVSFAEISSPKWSHVAPFRVGELVASVRRKFGSFAISDPYLKANYGSEDGDVSFKSSNGKITKVTYACYTG